MKPFQVQQLLPQSTPGKTIAQHNILFHAGLLIINQAQIVIQKRSKLNYFAKHSVIHIAKCRTKYQYYTYIGIYQYYNYKCHQYKNIRNVIHAIITNITINIYSPNFTKLLNIKWTCSQNTSLIVNQDKEIHEPASNCPSTKIVLWSRMGVTWHSIEFMFMSKTLMSGDGTDKWTICVTLFAKGLKRTTILKAKYRNLVDFNMHSTCKIEIN